MGQVIQLRSRKEQSLPLGAEEYPFAALNKISVNRVPPEVQGVLVKRSRLHANQGSWCLHGDVVYIGIRFSDGKLAKRSMRVGKAAIFGYNWPTNFGRVFSFSLAVPGVKRAASCRTVIPFSDPCMNRLSEVGKAVYVVVYGKKVLAAFTGDFRARPASARGFEKVLAYDDAPGCYDNFDAAYWFLHASTKDKWSDRLTVGDRLSLGWVEEYELVGHLLEKVVDVAREQRLRNEFESDVFSRNIPLLQKLVLAAIDGDDARQAVRDALFGDESGGTPVDLANTVFWDVYELHSNCEITQDEFQLVDILKTFVLLDPLVTDCGRRLFWTDSCVSPAVGRTIALNVDLLGQYTEPGFWPAASFLKAPINIGHYLCGDECLADVSQGLGLDLSDGVSLEDAEAQARSLIVEATSERQWTIPWGALVDFRAGIFQRVEIFEVLEDFCFKIWTNDSRCVLACVGRTTGSWLFEGIRDDHERIAEQFSALKLLLASVVRDFCVVEERERLFRQSMKSRKSKVSSDGKRVIYLPRFKYVESVDPSAISDRLNLARRSPHFVVGHLRKSENRSPESEKLARAYGFVLQPGYTFVRPHRRGTNSSEKDDITFRSRSALELMCGDVSGEFTGVADWFKFELDIKKLMMRFGFRVQHRSASRNGDEGVDIYAEDPSNNEMWAIQCKCYRPDRTIGPAVVRELIGAVHGYPSGTKGMLVATCRVSDKARRLAGEANIMVLDGDDLTGLVKDEKI